MTFKSISLLLVQQLGGEANVSLFAAGDRGGYAAKNVANCRCIKDAHRRLPCWILACRWFVGWQSSVLIVKPETVLRWHREGWRTYWRWRSRRTRRPGRLPIPLELRTLIRCMAADNRLWGQRRIQAELSRLGFKVSRGRMGDRGSVLDCPVVRVLMNR